MNEQELKAYLRDRFDHSKTQVELRGGPWDGQCHEVEPGWPIPSRLGLERDTPAGPVTDWYDVHQAVGQFDHTERS
jgi:hypothetical protein